ncbi:GTP cyclohydrolase [Fibrisoma montanum]|uniref:GTP cyclohydrolase n=1 Tax=Fibrisoma montanum TaxID=2305895 RepID=A0A418MKB5_9BACT|nr:YciI family protein [Fibrisoma montanum]RIV27771.1 GTP cyclohydrolase [Fibrisoma montanum]
MFLIELTYIRDLAYIDSLLRAHNAFLQQHYDAGHFLFSGRKVPREGGLIVANFSSLQAAHEAIQQDPFYQYGAAEYRFIEFAPTRVHPDAQQQFEHVVNNN